MEPKWSPSHHLAAKIKDFINHLYEERKIVLRNGKEGNMVQVTQLPYSNDLESATDTGSGQYFNKFIDTNFYEFITYRKYCNLVVHSFSLVQLFATLWTAAHQASLSLTISQNLPMFMSIASVMPSSHLIL